MTMNLPEPTRERWQPLRAGLIDVFYYDREEFWFHDGRLLLRGNNGTGKSKVLALMLPFLFDGDLAAHRVEPDADPKKRMEWNLLLGGAHPHPERLGYTWLEFGRLAADGTAEYRTLGCGLKAVTGRGIARHWFFVTDQRPGPDLRLVDATGTALAKDRLIDALADRGSCFETARSYRRAVDEALFGLGEQRYGALVDLLIHLRQPQLSKRPSERALSDALTEALPPLDQAVLADVAEAFRSLEEDRDALTSMVEARTAADTFLTHYRRYAQVASRRRAGQPRAAQSEYERVRSALSAAEQDFAAAAAAVSAAEQLIAEVAQEQTRLQARDRALRESPEMRGAEQIHLAAEHAKELKTRSDKDFRAAAGARDRLRQRADEREKTGRTLRAAEDGLAGARREASVAARAALLERAHADQLDAALTPPVAANPAEPRLDQLPDEQHLTRIRQNLERACERRRQALAHLQSLIDGRDQAARTVAENRRRCDDLDSETAELQQRRQDADERVTGCGKDLVSAIGRHLSGTVELRVGLLPDLLSTLELWVETLDGANPARVAVGLAGQASTGALATAIADLGQQDRQLADRQRELSDELARLERGDDTAPPPPHTRDEQDRRLRPGAPLWQVADFGEHLTASERAGLEAALEAAGILDAWVTPDGYLLQADTQDVMIQPGSTGPGSSSLLGPLVAAVDRADPMAAGISDETVTELLAAIGLGVAAEDRPDSGTWVSIDGRFRIGVLTGSWQKPQAEYLGRGARENARRARITVLQSNLGEIETGRAELADLERAFEARRVSLSTEIATLPSDDELLAAHLRVGELRHQGERLSERSDRARANLTAALDEEQKARGALTESATELGLPDTAAELAEIGVALGGYRVALAEVWPAVRNLRRSVEDQAGAERELQRAVEDEHQAAAEAEATAADTLAAQERYETLQRTLGAEAEAVLQELAEIKRLETAATGRRRQSDQDRDRAIDERGQAQGRRLELADKVEAATRTRIEAASALQEFCRTGLVTVGLPDLALPDLQEPWAPDPTVRLARQIEAELAKVEIGDEVWNRLQRRVNDEIKTLQDTLGRRGNTLSTQALDAGLVVEVVFHGRATTVPELVAALHEEVEQRQRLLDERERTILENHLVNEVASALQELMSEAEGQVEAMNRELSDRPTSTGMRLRLLWQPREDGPAGLSQARERLLRQTADAWSVEDRSAVGSFLQAQITRVREADQSGTWLDHLTAALDYRSWNRFVIQRHQNGQWRSASGPASGGERVLAASVPLFAAASAHYASAGNPHAPRLVMLDEAFAGVDDNARAKYLGLLAAFDLDVVMTSEREWGCYPEVPGLAICQLSRTDDVAAVLVTNWRWDGRRRTRIPRPEAVSTPVSVPAAPSAAQDGLWG